VVSECGQLLHGSGLIDPAAPMFHGRTGKSPAVNGVTAASRSHAMTLL
jgi:hypothetical protein